MPPSRELPSPDTIERLPDVPLNFLDINSIKALRANQKDLLQDAEDDVLGQGLVDSDEVATRLTEARLAAETANTERIRDYLLQYIHEDDPKFLDYLSHLTDFSINNMTDDVLTNGQKRPDKTYDPSTAGWRKILDYRVRATEALTPPPGPELTPEQIAATQKALAEGVKMHPQLKTAVEQLAKSQALRRHRFLPNFITKKDSLAKNANFKALAEAKDAALKQFAEQAIAAFKTAHPTATPEQLQSLAAQLTKEHFIHTIEEQSKPEYVQGRWALAARKIGNLSLPRRIAVGVGFSVAGAGAAALTIITGGAAAAFVGIPVVAAIRGGTSARGGTFGHGTADGTKKVMTNVVMGEGKMRKLVGVDKDKQLTYNQTTDAELAQAISERSSEATKRINRSDKTRRAGTAAMFAASMIPVVNFGVKRLQNADNARHMKDAAKQAASERATADKATKAAEATKKAAQEKAAAAAAKRPVTLATAPNPANNAAIPTANALPPSPSPNAMPYTPPSAESIQRTVSGAAELVDAGGKYPYDQAVAAFGGNKSEAIKWLERAVENTEGARWHNIGGIGTDDWISVKINGKSFSDTATVMARLRETSPF